MYADDALKQDYDKGILLKIGSQRNSTFTFFFFFCIFTIVWSDGPIDVLRSCRHLIRPPPLPVPCWVPQLSAFLI